MKKIFFSFSALFCLSSTLPAETLNFDFALKTGLTSINNEDGWHFEKGTFAADVTFDMGYALDPRVDLVYINIDEKTGTVNSLLQLAVDGQYDFKISDTYYVDPYFFGGLGFEYVDGSRRGFENQFFLQGGAGVKYPVNENFSLVAELKGVHILDKNRNDEQDEFAFLIGASMPFHIAKGVPDQDRDGVLNADDLCPNTPAGISVDANGCPIEKKETRAKKVIVLDSDNDGITDEVDECPATPYGFKVNKAGCGIKKTLEVHFESDSARLTSFSMQKIKEFADYMKKMPEISVTIEGYTDSSGDPKKNMQLSQKRANSVKKALISYGVSPDRLTAVGKGSLNPIADNETKAGRAKNRRIEAIIHH